jgi:curved DNA-binding protein CbpA
MNRSSMLGMCILCMLLTWPQQIVAGKQKEKEADSADSPAFIPMTPSLRRLCLETLNIGLHEELSESRISQAFRPFALSLHPDKCGGDQTKLKRFQEINNMRHRLLEEVQHGLRFVTDYPVFRNSNFDRFKRSGKPMSGSAAAGGSAASGGAAAGGAAGGGAAAGVPMAQQEFWQQAWQTLESEIPQSYETLVQRNAELRAKNAEQKESMETSTKKENEVIILSDDEVVILSDDSDEPSSALIPQQEQPDNSTQIPRRQKLQARERTEEEQQAYLSQQLSQQACNASAAMEAGMDMADSDRDDDESYSRAGRKRTRTNHYKPWQKRK